jgi:transcriptional regulator with XRE-family HTH domain
VADEFGPVAARFGAVVRETREAQRISQEDLAQRAGLHRTYVSMIERGRRTASLAVVEKLAAALGTSMQDLVRRAEAL